MLINGTFMQSSPENKLSSTETAPQARIMIVDDSLIARRMVRFALQDLPCDVFEAEDGSVAWDVLQRADFSLLITDLYMPRLNGIELIRKLRNIERGADMPIILLTTETCELQEQEARKAGVSLFIRKPFQPEQLAGLVRQVIA